MANIRPSFRLHLETHIHNDSAYVFGHLTSSDVFQCSHARALTYLSVYDFIIIFHLFLLYITVKEFY